MGEGSRGGEGGGSGGAAGGQAWRPPSPQLARPPMCIWTNKDVYRLTSILLGGAMDSNEQQRKHA